MKLNVKEKHTKQRGHENILIIQFRQIPDEDMSVLLGCRQEEWVGGRWRKMCSKFFHLFIRTVKTFSFQSLRKKSSKSMLNFYLLNFKPIIRLQQKSIIQIVANFPFDCIPPWVSPYRTLFQTVIFTFFIVSLENKKSSNNIKGYSPNRGKWENCLPKI